MIRPQKETHNRSLILASVVGFSSQKRIQFPDALRSSFNCVLKPAESISSALDLIVFLTLFWPLLFTYKELKNHLIFSL